MKVVVAQALGRERIHVWRRNGRPVTAEVAKASVVQQDHQHVGSIERLSASGPLGCRVLVGLSYFAAKTLYPHLIMPLSFLHSPSALNAASRHSMAAFRPCSRESWAKSCAPGRKWPLSACHCQPV